MKIGRNAPCPCGSGKKYKKCCLNKSVAPPEALHYRRLSEVHDKLWPKLADYGESVFGKMAPQVAFSEFLAWPAPDDAPDEEAIERAMHIFWPWYIFNWEYCELDDEENLLSGPEDTTITELFLQKKQFDPRSVESRFLTAANRTPYSFHEVVSTDVGHTVRIRDVLTGCEVLVQERLGSEYLQNGDIIFGRGVQVDDVGMFLGLSSFKIPPRMKPEVIGLRRRLTRSGGMLTAEDLYEWDLDIRKLFWDMDRRLHTMPQMVNTDGDPMEFHRLVFDIDSAEQVVKRLANLSECESLDEIFDNAERDENGQIRRVMFSWNRKGNRMNKGMPNTVLGNVEIEKGRLIVTVNSAERARSIRAEIERQLKDLSRFRLDEISNLDASLNQKGSQEAANPSHEMLASHPEVQRQIEQMLQKHWENWVDQEIPLLDNKTPRQAVNTKDGREAVEALLLDAENMSAGDPARSTAEKKFIDDVRRRLKLDKPLVKKPKNIDSRNLAERIDQIKHLLFKFGVERLPDIYAGFCRDLCDAIAESEDLNLHLGRIEIWTAAIVYAVARLNFLFGPETPNHLTADEICARFGVKKTTVGNKATKILETLGIFHDDKRFCAPHITRLFEFAEDEHGFIYPVAALEPEGESTLEPIALKPSGQPEKASAEGRKAAKREPVKRDDKQCMLFPD